MILDTISCRILSQYFSRSRIVFKFVVTFRAFSDLDLQSVHISYYIVITTYMNILQIQIPKSNNEFT